MFLIEQLPSEGKQVTDREPINKRSLLMQCISAKIGEELNSIWIPPCCNPPNKKTIGDFFIPSSGNCHNNLIIQHNKTNIDIVLTY